MAGCGSWHVTSRPSALSDWAPWVPASRRCSPATGTPSWAWRSTTTRVERGRQHLEHSTARAVARGKLTEEDAEGAARAGHASPPRWRSSRTPTWWSRRSWSPLEIKKQIFKQLDGIVARRHHPRDQHLVAVGHRDLDRQLAARAGSSACTSSTRRPVQGFVEIVRTVVTEPEVLEDVSALVKALGKNPVVCGDKAGFIANTLLFGYLNHAVSMYENRYASREDIDAAMRFGCGYPMGPLALLDLIGLDTAYEILDTMYRQGRDRLHAPGADPQADGHRRACSAARPARASTATRRPTARSSSPTTRRPRPTTSRSCKHDIKLGRRGRHRHDGDRHRRGLRQGAGTTSSTSAARRTRSTASRTTIERSLDKAIQRGKLEEAAKDDVLGRLTGSTSLDDLGQVDIVVEAIAEDLQDQDHAVREPRRDLQARRDPRDDDVVAADHPVRAGDQPPAGRRRDALLQPGADHEAGRGGPHRLHHRRRHRDHAGAVRQARQGRGLLRRPRRASSSTRCCSPTSTTRSRCSRRTTRPPTTSTPR